MGELLAGVSLRSTRNLPHRVHIEEPKPAANRAWEPENFPEFLDRVAVARRRGAPVIAFLGSHVLQLGLQPHLIRLIEDGWITHVAVTGAASEYDVELALLGQTDVIEEPGAGGDASGWGMWKETGDAIHRAVSEGWRDGLGYGESLGCCAAARPADFPFREYSLFYQAYVHDVPYTCHITIGLDEVHAHPAADFAALGGASGQDFRVFCRSVADLEHGVFLNFGSTVTGVEVFLKALSIARNLGYVVQRITTANFDVVRLGDYRKKVGYEDWDYYYRPRKNVVHRPTSMGGRGFHFEGDHRATIPTLREGLRERGGTLRGSDFHD
ncbi:MAG: GSU2086 family protein [Bacilli bacterium]